MNSRNRMMAVWLFLVEGVVCTALALSLSAQVQTQTTTTAGQPTVETKVERAEVVNVSGNDLIVKMEDGTIRHFVNVPESARVTVDGQQLGIHDLRPGMKLQRTIKTTTTPKTITTVQTVTGRVWQVTPPTSVILTLEDGSNQQFKIPKDQKFNVDGQMVDAWGLKRGMKVSATKVAEQSVTEIEHQRKLTGSMPPPPPTPPADAPILVAKNAPPPTPAASAAPAELPKTGTFLPLFGLLGMLSLTASLGLRMFRKSS